MSEELQNQEPKNQTIKTENTKKEPKKIKRRTIFVLILLAIYIIGSLIVYRADYLETLEIGEEYLEVFIQNQKYKQNIAIVNFVIVFLMVYITNNLIKKGLKQFFDQEKKEMPKLPNKSLALAFALITSAVVSTMFLQKVILFTNCAWFGMDDPTFGMDVGFYMFQAPLIGQLLYYGITLLIILTVYTVIYYIIVFNKYFDGIDGQTLRGNTFIKQLLWNAMLIVIFMAGIVIFNMQNMVINGFLTLDERIDTTLIGAGATDNIKLWGYRIFAVIMILAVYIAIKAFKKNNTKKVIKSLAIVPIYLVCLFVVMVGYNLIFVKGSELEKQKDYIGANIEFTKIAYDIKIEEKDIISTGTITEEEAEKNNEVITNIPVVTEEVAKNNLLQTQTNTGYYTYNKAKSSIYENNLTYISARELDGNHSTEEYTHGYGVAIISATETDEAGNVKYISRDLENQNLKEPRIYYGVENKGPITVGNGKIEFDYPKGATGSAKYTYNGEGGLKLGILDRLCVSLREGKLNVLLANSEDQIMLNRNVIKRAKKVLPYLMYDENPYLIIADDGNLYWVVDAYTVSNEYPYSQKTKIEYGKETKELNYIRNSVKVLVNAFDGDTKFYITDKTDPIAMVYNKMYKDLFKDADQIPEGISKHFTYSEFLYEIQSEMLNLYHDVSADVLYRANDVWEIASYSNLITRTAAKKMKPYYTKVKTETNENGEIGLVIAYNQLGRESLNAYLVGTVEQGKNKLSLYKFTGDSTVLGPMQLDSLIEQDETISKEISSLNVTGTKITKEMIIVPIENTLLYVVPIYQTSLNETNSVPVLKKVAVASGNKIAIGDDLAKAIKNLLSPTGSVSVRVEDNSTIEGLIEQIIRANNNLTESNASTNWEQIGRDIETLQKLIKQLEETKKEEDKNNTAANTTINNTTLDNNTL